MELFQRFGGYSIISVEWALNGESLGRELGTYRDRADNQFFLTEFPTDLNHGDWAPAGINNPSNPLLVTLLPLRLNFPNLASL